MSDMTTTITLGSVTLTLTLGEIIRKLREDAGMKQTDLAPLVRTSRAAIAGWENNTHRPAHATLVRLADIFDCDVSVFPDEQGVPLSRCTGDHRWLTLVAA